MLLFVHPFDVRWPRLVSSQTGKNEIGFCFVETRNKAEDAKTRRRAYFVIRRPRLVFFKPEVEKLIVAQKVPIFIRELVGRIGVLLGAIFNTGGDMWVADLVFFGVFLFAAKEYAAGDYTQCEKYSKDD